MRVNNIRSVFAVAAAAIAAVPHMAHASAVGDAVRILLRHYGHPF